MQSFVSLLNLRPLDKITVKDIADTCGVNRNTFYYYFQDIYALLDEVFLEETQKVVGKLEDYSSWQEAFLRSTEFAMENRKAIYHVYNSMNREQLERYLYDVTGYAIMGFVKKQSEGLSVSHEDIGLIVDFYKFAIVGMVLDWISNGMSGAPDRIISRMAKIVEGNIRFSLEKICSGKESFDKGGNISG